MDLRIAWFKVTYPLVYYTAYFSVRATHLHLAAHSHGKTAVKAAILEITDKGLDASAKTKQLLTVYTIANTCHTRGFKIKNIHVTKSDSTHFHIQEHHTLLAHFRAVPGLGDNVAKQIVAARTTKHFLSKTHLANRD